MSDRRDELIKLIPEESVPLLSNVIDDIVNLEERLEYLRSLPHIDVNPKNPLQQRATPASKLYKEYLQQYINCIKAVEYVIYKDKRLDDGEAEESPLRRWYREYANKK